MAPASRIYGTGAPALAGSSDRDITVVGVGGIPASNVDAVLVSVEISAASRSGYLRVAPTGNPSQIAVQEFGPGQTISNLVTVKGGYGGKITLHMSAGSAHIFADTAGFFG